MPNQPGRPRLPPARLRKRRLSVSFTPLEMERIRRHARRVNLRVAEFVRDAALLVAWSEKKPRWR